MDIFFELDKRYAKTQEEKTSKGLTDQYEPGFLDGVGTGVANGFMRGGARAAQFAGLLASPLAIASDAITGGTARQDEWFSTVDSVANNAVDYWTPDAASVGTLGQTLGGLAEIALPLMASAGNPTAAAAIVTGTATAGTGIDLSRKGVDSNTASISAAAAGAGAYLGFAIPMLGKNLLQRAGSGAVANVVTNAGSSAVIYDQLQGGGYAELAKQYDPADAQARTIDVLTGLALGGLAHLGAKGDAPQLTTAQRDAILAARNAKSFQADTAPGRPVTAEDALAHQQAMEQTLQQLMRDEPVEVPPAVASAKFAPRTPSAMQEAAKQAQASSLAAGDRYAPSNRLATLPAADRGKLAYNAPELNEYAAYVERQNGLPPGLINALKNAGERSNSGQVSPVGARGVMQFMPENLKKFGVADPTDPVQSIDGAARYLKETLRQYGGNVEAVIADYNGGPRQARRVMNGEQPAAPETRAYLERVRAELQRDGEAYATPTPAPQAFAEKVGRQYQLDEQGRPTFTDGTAYPRENILDFYDSRVAQLEAKSADPMPDVMFRIGTVDEQVAKDLATFLPGFNDSLREARISAQSVKHIHDSRPGIAREVLQRLDDGVLYADEVLPNPKNPKRALVVLREVPSGSTKAKNGVTVLEVSANGKGIDVVSSMTGPDKYLKEARALKDAKVADLAGGAAVPSSSLSDGVNQQHHPAADFPVVSQDPAQSIAQPDSAASQPAAPGRRSKVDEAAQMATEAPDTTVIHGFDDAGNPVSRPISEALAEVQAERAQAAEEAKAYQAAVSCFIRRGQ